MSSKQFAFKHLALKRWREIMTALDLPKNDGVYRQLLAAYREPQRHYHNLSHIEACFNHVEQIRQYLTYPAEVLLALWFHDVIYQPIVKDNELKSALWLQELLEQGDRPPAQIERICGHILATEDHRAETNVDRQFLLDIDLSILGCSNSVFCQFENNIRREYHWIPEQTYHRKRLAVLTTYLERPSIYQTDYFQAKYESPARQNLTQAIARHRRLAQQPS